MKKYLRFNSRGQDLVEFAITLPLLALIVFAIFDIGRAGYYYSAMQNAAREGARYAIVHPDDTSGVTSFVRGKAIGMNPADLNVSMPLAWADEDIVQVKIEYTFTPVTPFVGGFFPGGGVPIVVSSTMQREKWE